MTPAAPRAYRCTPDDVNWPMTPAYRICPLCGQPTWEAVGERPLGVAEAQEYAETEKRRRARHEAFEAFYAQREAELLIAEALGEPASA